MANQPEKRKLAARIMAWVMSILMAGSCAALLISLLVEMASK